MQALIASAEVASDRRPEAPPPTPANELSAREREVKNSASYRRLPPSPIVPARADEGRYLASEPSFYRAYGSKVSNTSGVAVQDPEHLRRPRAQ
jgi:putative transposase